MSQCYDINATNTSNFSNLWNNVNNRQARPSPTPLQQDIQHVIENNNCDYQQVCQNSFSTTNYNEDNARVGVVHNQNRCTIHDVCKDNNAMNVTTNLDKGKHNQSECRYRDTCPYSGVNIKNYDSNHNIVENRDNCDFKTPKCLNQYASNKNVPTSSDNLDTENEFNYGCEFSYGCTDTEAHNYDSDAVIDDGSCEYKRGCTYTEAPNYDSDAEIDDGNCNFTRGCTYQQASNYNADAVIDDGSCIFEEGCTYSHAEGYNPNAIVDDGSCIFNRNLFNSDNWNMRRGCLEPDNSAFDRTADYDYPMNGNSSCSRGISVNGCIEPKASNYDSNATIQTRPCDWKEGCTYESAKNYDEDASQDDGSCIFESEEQDSNYLALILFLILVILVLVYKMLS